MATVSERQLREFRKMLGKVVPHDISFVSDEKLVEIFEVNFESNLSLAERVLFNKYDEVKRKEYPINGIEESAELFLKHVKAKKPTLLLTDNDNDGSLAQAVMMAAKDLDGELLGDVHVEFSQNINPKKSLHGITLEVVQAWVDKYGYKKDDELMIVTADNGIQSKEEVELILKHFPNSKIIITDHHLPSEKDTPTPSSRLKIVDPMYKPEGHFKNTGLNISGANVFSWFLKNVIRKNNPSVDESSFEVFDNIERHSNAMDFVKSALSNYPIKSYEIKENTELRALMNINNSVRSLVNRDLDSETIEKMKAINPDFDESILLGSIDKIKNLNLLASKYLNLYRDFNDLPSGAKKISSSAHYYFSAVNYMLDEADVDDSSINQNFIEQLRPIIFYYLSNPNKSDFESEFFEDLKKVFLELKKCESEIVKELRKLDLMHVIKEDAVTVLYPKDFDLLKFFDRKLLMKVYNENNNGVFMAITHKSPESTDGRYIVNGSFRGVDYSAEQIMESVGSDFKELSIKLKGHSLAAGVFLESKKEISFDTISRLVDFLNYKVKESRVGNEKSQKDEVFYLFDTTNMDIAKDFNSAIRGYLPNLVSIEPLFKITKNTKFKSKETGKAITVGKMLDQEKYGYAVLELNFEGDALILPVEVVRALSENNFKDFIKLSQIDDSAFIANSVVKRSEINPKNIRKIKSSFREDETELMKKYQDLVENNYSRVLSRDDILNMDLFKRNLSYGEGEFDRVEELIISQMDKLGVDVYSVLDVEANGLGRPELFNFGTLDITIKEGSGVRVPLSEYKKIKFNDKEYDKFIKKHLGGQSVKNIKYDELSNEIIINRELNYEMFAMIIRSNDFSILSPIEQLTGISQTSINKYGVDVSVADEIITRRHKGKKVAVVAHNTPYDSGVIRANLPLYTDLLKSPNIIICDTAPLAKTNALGYSDMSIAIIDVFPDALFYNNKHADFSLIRLVESPDDFTFPDIRGEYVLKRRSGKYFIVDKKNNIEQDLPVDDEYLLTRGIKNRSIPKNKVKYGVQFLLKNAGIRNMLLDQISEKKIKLPETPDYIVSAGIEQEYVEFCENFNFGGNVDKNLINYTEYLREVSPERYSKFTEYMFGSEDLKDSYLEDPELFESRQRDEEKKKQKEIDKVLDELKKEKITKGAADLKLEKIEEKYDNRIVSLDNMSLFIEAVDDFFEVNKDIYLRYSNNWEYQALLDVYDPMKAVISKNDLERVSYLTSLPEKRIKEMVKEIYDYKKKIGIEKEPFYIKELHNNIDERGDMVIEHFAVLNALTAKYYNRYSNVMSEAPKKILNQAYLESDTAFSRTERFHITVSNSASTKQLEGYSRKNLTKDAIAAKNIQEIVLKNSLLQPTMNIVAEKSFVEAGGHEGIKEIQDDLNFVIAYDLIAQSDDYTVIASEMTNRSVADLPCEDDLIGDFLEWSSNGFSDNMLEIIINNMDDTLKETVSEVEYKTYLQDMLKTFNYYNNLGSNNEELVSEMLRDLEVDYVESYKRVYDKIGFFYVMKAKDDIKKVIDSIQANIISNTDRFNFKTKTLTQEIVEEIKDVANYMVEYFRNVHGYELEPDNVVALMNAVDGITTIDDDIRELIEKSYKVMSSDNVSFNDLKSINPFIILPTKKRDRNKAIVDNLGIVPMRILQQKRDEKLKEESDLKISKKPCPK